MKPIILLLLALAPLTALAAAGDPPPPKNPFQNLPSTPDPSAFNPFDDEMDDSRFVPPSNSGASPFDTGTPGTGPINSSSRSGMASGPTSGGRPASGPGKSMTPASAKDIVENFDYPDAEILDVAKAISRLTGRNFIYNPQDVKGKISIVSESPITVGDAWNAFLAALNMKGFAIVPSGKYLRIERTATAKEKQVPIYTGRDVPNSEEFITRVIPLRYIDAYEVESVFRAWIPRESRMQAFQQTNTVIITSTSAHINQLMQLIAMLDVAGYQESLVVLPIRNAAAKDIAKLIEQIINESQGSGANARFGATRPTATPPSYSPTARPGTGRGAPGRNGGVSISKIIADDRTNSLIVKANAAGINEIKVLVNRLDTKVAAGEGTGRIHVKRLQFADAEQMAKTLQAITQGSGASSAPRTTFLNPYGGGAPANTGTVFQGEIKISADKTTQSLVVTASPADYATMNRVIESLDVPRDQVFVEAIIMEMKLNRDSAYGTSFVSAPNGTANPSASGNLATILSGNPLGIGGFALGFKSGIERPGIKAGDKEFKFNSLNGLLEFIQGNTDTNVIATPRIIALDNEEAVMEISELIPQESTSTANNGTTTNSLTSDKAQLLLKVTPQINKASDFVKLKIDQKLENFDSGNVPKALQDRAKGKNSRSTVTSVVVQNEDTVVLSGLMRDSVNEIVSKVPILGDIPILGWLFKSTKTEARKTNLLVFITPRIIKQYEMVRKVLERALEERDQFVTENIGSRDPLLKGVQKLRKSLPRLDRINPFPTAPDTGTSTTINAPSSPDRDDAQPGYGDYYDPYPGDFGSQPVTPIEPPPISGVAPGGDFGAPPPPPPPPPPPEGIE